MAGFVLGIAGQSVKICADTTVQLNDGQSLVIAGLIKNNVTEAVKLLYDTAISSIDWGSGFLDHEEEHLIYDLGKRLGSSRRSPWRAGRGRGTRRASSRRS